MRSCRRPRPVNTDEAHIAAADAASAVFVDAFRETGRRRRCPRRTIILARGS